MRLQHKIIAVDFDGTCVTHEYPKVGRDIGAGPVLRRLVAEGAKLVLFTMRSDRPHLGENPLADAVQWFADNNLPLHGVNRNPDQDRWTTSPKAYAHLYIDDAALGVPLLKGRKNERPHVNWKRVERMLLP